MIFSDLKMALTQRGVNIRVGEYINRSYHWMCEYAEWPFLFTTSAGAAPLTVSDLSRVLSVSDSTNAVGLDPSDMDSILNIDPSNATAGAAKYWYLSSSTQVSVWPTNTTPTISVHYLKAPTDLAAVTDTPLIPTRYHRIIVDYAQMCAFEDAGNFQAAQALQQKVEQDMVQMTKRLLANQADQRRAGAGAPK